MEWKKTDTGYESLSHPFVFNVKEDKHLPGWTYCVAVWWQGGFAGEFNGTEDTAEKAMVACEEVLEFLIKGAKKTLGQRF